MKIIGIIITAILIAGVVPQVIEAKWYNPRVEFWPELKDWEYVDEFELIVKVVSFSKKTPDIIISSNGHKEIIDSKDFKNHKHTAKVKLYFDSQDLDKKEKVTIKALGSDKMLSKSFKTSNGYATVEFFYGGRN